MSKVPTTGFIEKAVFVVDYKVPDNPGLVWYYFVLQQDLHVFHYGNNSERLGGEGQLCIEEPPSYQVTVYRPMQIPSWFKEGIIYQIYVDRFYNGNENGLVLNPRKNSLIHGDWFDTPFYIKDERGRVIRWNFFGGNLQGVLQKLPYLKELGITILYLNPIFDSPSNHKYDTADYKKIDPMYGDNAVFRLLIQEAKRYGIRIILDGVFSHTGSDSVYFNKYGHHPNLGAYQSSDSPYYPWFRFKEKGEYECWWGVEDLPEVNKLEPTYQKFIFGSDESVTQTWMKEGVSGWRLDVADELPDVFIQELRQAMKKVDPDSVLIGEVWEDASNKFSYGKLREYFWGDELDSVMNYPFREIFLRFMLGQIGAHIVHDNVMSLYENYPRENFYAAMNLIGSHDRERILTLLGDAPTPEGLTERERERFRLSSSARQLAIKRLKLLTLIQMGFPGVPSVYYGDEVGLEGYADPYNRGTYPWGKEDFEILEWFKRVIRIRREYEVLQTGDFLSFSVGDDLYGFKRMGIDEEVIFLINRHPTQVKEISLEPFSLVVDLLNGRTLIQENSRKQKINVEPLTGSVLFCKKINTISWKNKLSRSCGVLLHVSSLPSPWGIGDMGDGAYQFIDFLAEAEQSIWQVLPLNPVGVGNSPYQSDSAYAGNDLLISVDPLIEEGLISREEAEKSYTDYSIGSNKKIEFSQIRKFKIQILVLAFKRFKKLREELKKKETDERREDYLSFENYRSFMEENKDWLEDFALYRALKSIHLEAPWYEWEPRLALREKAIIPEYSDRLAEEIEFIKFVQYNFFTQWKNLKNYANAKGIKILGDMPIFVASDSCDTWSNRQFFALDEKGRPLKVAGVPPDYFCTTGQLWGNPVYDWDALAEVDYSWWKQRMKQALKLYDFIRLDHFRGFEAYWEISSEEETAVKGRWMKGPSKQFFDSLSKTLGPLPVIAEDLGVITPEVNALKSIFSFPGMKVIQFTPLEEIENESDTNYVLYSGTHDNDTLLGWYKRRGQANEQFEEHSDHLLESCRELMEKLYESNAAWVILPLQDILGHDSEARMNTPGTIEGNWQWRLEKHLLKPQLKEWLKLLAQKNQRESKH
jgi:4-alpha-glucanotransferase